MNGVVGSSHYPVVADDLVIFPDWDPAPSTSRDADRVLRAFRAYHPLITVGAYHAYIISPGGLGGDHSTRLYAVDPHNGQQRWTYTLQNVTGMPTPIVVGDWADNPSSPVNVYLPVRDGVVALRPKIDLPFSRERWHWQADAIDSTDHIRGLAAADGRPFIVVKRKTGDMDPPPELVALE